MDWIGLDRFGIDLGSTWDQFGIDLESIWDRFGISLGSIWNSASTLARTTVSCSKSLDNWGGSPGAPRHVNRVLFACGRGPFFETFFEAPL